MLVHFRCHNCGAMMVAREHYIGQPVACRFCRQETVVPDAAGEKAQAPAVPQGLARGELSALPMAQIEQDARRIAWLEARQAARGRGMGIVLMILGALPTAFAALCLVTRSSFGFSPAVLAASAAFGTLAIIMGAGIVRIVAETTHFEFRRRLPLVVERLQRQAVQQRRSRGLSAEVGSLRLAAPQQTPTRDLTQQATR